MTSPMQRAYWHTLQQAVAAFITLLRKHHEKNWSEILANVLPQIAAHEPKAARDILSLYGGMGSLNDLWLCAGNGHVNVSAPVDVAEANEQASAYRMAIATAAGALFNLSLNIPDGEGGWCCPVCGHAGDLSQSYDAKGGIIGRGICRCCLWEPGFDDDLKASADAQTTVRLSLLMYREQWHNLGCPWRGNSESRPEFWDPTPQMAALKKVAPQVF
jgi:hypothetical protein